MDLRPTPEQELLRRTVREFAEKEIRPYVMEWDEAQGFSPELLPKLASLGLMGIQVPEAYGGAGMSSVDYCICIEELARVDPSIALSVAAHNGLSVAHLYMFGNDEQKKKYVVPLAKGEQLGVNPQAALLFHWKALRRQVRIEGSVEHAADAEADAYFATRARDSQIGAWASDQSRPLDSRETFETQFSEFERKFAGQDVPRPPHWGGYRLVPQRIEFWTDRPHRLHERRLFTRGRDGWSEGLLYP